jgi:hypothetical protein
LRGLFRDALPADGGVPRIGNGGGKLGAEQGCNRRHVAAHARSTERIADITGAERGGERRGGADGKEE